MVSLVSILVGFIVPLLVSFLKDVKWSRRTKYVFSMAVSVVAAAANMFLQGELHSWFDLVVQAAVVWGVAQVNYKTWFGDTALNVTLENAGVGR